MLTGSELSTAITAVLIGAVCVGFLLHWLWSHMNRLHTSDGARLGEMAAPSGGGDAACLNDLNEIVQLAELHLP